MLYLLLLLWFTWGELLNLTILLILLILWWIVRLVDRWWYSSFLSCLLFIFLLEFNLFSFKNRIYILLCRWIRSNWSFLTGNATTSWWIYIILLYYSCSIYVVMLISCICIGLLCGICPAWVSRIVCINRVSLWIVWYVRICPVSIYTILWIIRILKWISLCIRI